MSIKLFDLTGRRALVTGSSQGVGHGCAVQFARAGNLQTTGVRFAALMRELAQKNGGTFVGLNDFRR